MSSIGLDLGSTAFKAARLEADGTLGPVASVRAPRLAGKDPIHEGQPEEFLHAAESVLARVDPASNTRIGLASQRSTFLVWDRTTGRTLTPVVSWQDRRAQVWCEAHGPWSETMHRVTGLPLSPHYLGPKLASMMEKDRTLAGRVRAGDALVGTLDAWLTWVWTGGSACETDLTMAARTLLADPVAGTWSATMLETFGIPEASLPRIVGPEGRALDLGRWGTMGPSMADQAAGLAAVVEDEEAVLINMGTGVFVLVPSGRSFEPKRGYLVGPRLSRGPETAYAVEGTINGGGSALEPYGAGPTVLPEVDPTPGVFCLPDCTGVGSPHWRPDVSFTISSQLEVADARRVVLEGIIFRIREVVEDLCGADRRKVSLAGGLTREPFVPDALAACLGRAVEVQEAPHATLLGAARFAAGMPPFGGASSRSVEAGPAGEYLREKYLRWRDWMASLL